jgi:hypothetical protein
VDDPPLVQQPFQRLGYRIQRAEQLGHPAGQGLAADLDTVALKTLLLAVQRQGIDKLGSDHMGQQGGVGHRFGDDLRRARGDLHPSLGTGNFIVEWSVLGTLIFYDVELAGNDRQLLGAVIADEGPLIAQGRLLDLRQVDDALNAGQVRWQRTTDRFLFRFSRCLFSGIRGCFGIPLGRLCLQLADKRFEFRLVEQVQLVVGELVATGPEAFSPQQLDVFEQLLNVLLALGQLLVLGLQLLGLMLVLLLDLGQFRRQIGNDALGIIRGHRGVVGSVLHGRHYTGFHQ